MVTLSMGAKSFSNHHLEVDWDHRVDMKYASHIIHLKETNMEKLKAHHLKSTCG